MHSTTGDISSPSAEGPVRLEADLTRGTRALSWLTATCIGSSILIMIFASLVRSDWMYPPVVMPSVGPPWVVQSIQVSPGVAVTLLWVATVLGAAGVVAGLVAVQRGARFRSEERRVG